jgi:transcriptional regulator GlxA family with amidase domain
VVTTAGVSAGIDGALHIVENLLGTPAAMLTAKQMEYTWQSTR